MKRATRIFDFRSSIFDFHEAKRVSQIQNRQRGIALLVVVSVVTVVAIMGVGFVSMMNLAAQASRHFSAATQARYIAEAGVSHALALLEEDKLGSRTDDLTEPWTDHLIGSDVDVDDSGSLDARWWLFEDHTGSAIGRYGVLITDEASKANLNTALADPQGMGVDAVNLTTLLGQIGIADAGVLAAAIELYRYGSDQRPGIALVDDDRDGRVDEPDEYQPLALRGDDRLIESLEELLGVGGLDAQTLRRLATAATVYSWDSNLSAAGQQRLNLNTATADELLSVLLETGVEDPWRMAANMADYADSDFAMSHVSKVAARYEISDQGPLGDWGWQAGSPAHYATSIPSGRPLVWDLAVPTGSFRLLVHGVPGLKVGDVTIEGQSRPSMDSGESFGILNLSGTITIRVACQQPAPTRCAFAALELVPSEGSAGLSTVVVRGIEAIRVNELMIAPTVQLEVGDALFDPQNSGWICLAGSCQNSQTGQARWSWTSSTIRPGRYHVRVYGTQAGQTVGEVRVDGSTAAMLHAQRHPGRLTVGSDQRIVVAIGKTPADGTYYFKRVSLSLEPDAEYVELINLSDQDVDASGWLIEGEATGGRQARLPVGSVIAAHGLLVAAVDANDTQAGLAQNGIDVRSAWEVPEEAKLVQLDFPGGAPSPDVDWLSVNLPGGTPARLVLRAGEWMVDEIEYPIPLPTMTPFQSLEKGDPSVVADADRDGLDEGWFPSLKLYTPGTKNDNEGLRELRGLEQIEHDPATEITVLNRPLRSVGELAGLPSGGAWSVVASLDLAKIADRLTVEGIRLQPEAHFVEGQGWQETENGYETSRQGALATWRWVDVPDGRYRLSLYGWGGEQLSVRWQLADGTYSEWIPPRTADAQGRIIVGEVTVGLEESLPNTFVLQARCESTSGVCHLSHICLDPTPTIMGTINVNTASPQVLLSLPGMSEEAVERLIADRPYGDKEHKARGIGDLLVGAGLGETESERLEQFRRLAHLISFRSQVFQILSVGESIERERPSASKRIQAIVQR